MRATFIDTDDELIEVPWADIEGIKEMSDGSWRFKLVGGIYHDYTVRVFPPCDRIVFPARNDTEQPQVYEIHPPVRKRGKWVYIHNPEGDTSPMAVTKLIRKETHLGSKR